MSEVKTAEQLAGEVKADFDKKFDELKAIATDALGRAEKGEPLTAGAKQTADEAITAVNEAKARLDEIEQKMARRGEEGPKTRKSAGYQFIENEEVKSFMANPRGGQRVSVEMEAKAIISSLTT